jgi:hypothetical protein
MNKKCPWMSWQYQPVGKEDGPMECIEKECALWTGLDCAILAMAKRR